VPRRPKTFGAKKKDKQRHNWAQADRHRGTASQRGPYCTAWWARKRVEIAVRDRFTCQACGCLVGIKKGDYTCDHIEERPVGAAIDTERWDSDSNLRILCVRCHARKTGSYGGRKVGGVAG
jgi:5-methylcytosine-specific restriction endonuclease McrA